MNIDPKKQTITGQAPPEAYGFVVETKDDTWREKVAKWYFKPLRAMKGDDAFVCLGVCFALYEKYLRVTGEMPEGQKFSEGHKVFKLVGAQINAKPEVAYLIWNSWRNGLLHRAMPNGEENVKWQLHGEMDVPVRVEGNTITLNPWLLRDRILKVVEGNREIWKDSEAPLMNVYEVTPLK